MSSSREVKRPWWTLAAFALAGVALALALSAGRLIEAVVIAILMVPVAFFLVVWGYFAFRRGDESR